ncbi:MAG: hypothetical protein ACT4OY_03965 [Alphaproteobacteria bacterium]
MISAITSALSGLQAATKQVAQSAERIANSTDPSTQIEDIINIKLAEASFKANVGTLKAERELTDELFRIFDEEV